MNYYWRFLSHKISANHFAYGDGKRAKLESLNSIDGGDTSNNSFLSFPVHYSTHLDFPFHFDNNGLKGDDYDPDYFISEKVQFININNEPILNRLITISDFSNIDLLIDTEILIIKTGMGNYINKKEYWNDNPGFSSKLAKYFKGKMPNLRFVGFDSISLTGRKFRSEGKEAHRSFLIKENILILEDMNLSVLKKDDRIKKIIISPLLFVNMDGSPATVFAKING